MNAQEFETLFQHPPIAKTKREVHLETLLKMALPYVEREELSTKTRPFTRHLITEIVEQIKGN